jgi:hypothetical protein
MQITAQPQYAARQGWWVCDKDKCLYDARAVERLRGHQPRCIKHGALLTWRWDGQPRLSRREVRRALGLEV